MEIIEKYDGQQHEQGLVHSNGLTGGQSDSNPSLIKPVLRRWYIVLTASILISAAGLPAIWLLIKPLYNVIGAVKVAPILPNILTGEADKGEISNYKSFMNTQAVMMTSSQVVQRVADDLVNQNLSFFENYVGDPVKKLEQRLQKTSQKPEPAGVLKEAIANGVIKAAPIRDTELIAVSMQSQSLKEAKQIVNAFIRAYMDVEVSSLVETENRKLNVLESLLKVKSDEMERQRQKIYQLAQEYGNKDLGGRYDMNLGRVSSLLAELTKLEAERMNLETQVQLLEKTQQDEPIGPEQLLQMRNDYINSDQTISVLVANVTQLEQQLIAAQQRLAPGNPELKLKSELIDTLKKRIKNLKDDAGKTFDDLMAEKLAKAKEQKLLEAKAKLEETKAQEQRFRDVLAKEDSKTIEVGRKQLEIQNLQDELALTKETCATIRRRIQELEMERKRPARISVAYYADVASVRDKRLKYSAALIFASLAFGMFVAFLRDRADRSLYTPEDVTKRVGVRIIGTTVRPNEVKKSLLPQQVTDDYQTIVANLGLMNGGGVPNKLVITSAGMRDGKTTFAINLATSLAKAGKKVLLVDGDLRKPDIRRLLGLPRGSRGLQDMIWEKTVDDVVHSVASGGFDVLTADSRNSSDAFALLSLPHVREYLNIISARYDHVIIDTPPVMAFSDALVWAKMAEGVILTSLAGHTADRDLRETINRLERIGARVLGTILNSVPASYSYNRYGYSYYRSAKAGKGDHRRNKRNTLLLPVNKKNTKGSKSKS